MRMDLNKSTRVFTHGLVIATTLVTCTALRAEHEDTHADKSAAHADRADAHGDKTQKFIHKALQGGKMEVQMGQLAQQKAQSQEVKDLGATLVRDHTAANQKLQQLASSKNSNASDEHARGEKGDKHDQMMNRLQNQSGAEFDKAFVRMAIKDHKKDIAEFEKCRTDVSDPQVKAFIDETLPKLRNHLQMAQSAAKAVGVDATTISEREDDSSDSATGAAAVGVSGSSGSSTTSDKNRHSLNESGSYNGATDSDSSGTLRHNNPSAKVEGNVGDHEINAEANVNKSSSDTSSQTSSDKKIFQKDDGKVLGLSTDKQDGKFLGVIPDPFKKRHEANAEVNVNTDNSSSSTAVGGSASTESGTSSNSSSDQK